MNKLVALLLKTPDSLYIYTQINYKQNIIP